MNDKYPFGKAIKVIFLSVILICGLPMGGFILYEHIKGKRANDESYRIVAIAQTSSGAESLKTIYLAELLDLSLDRPCSLYQFDLVKGLQKLLSSTLIKTAQLKKIPPGTLYVDYEMRRPIAALGDFTNTAMDAEGYLFPLKPFFTSKKLPEVYVGLLGFGDDDIETEGTSGKWGSPLQGHKTELALQVFNTVSNTCCNANIHLMKIDTSKAFALSYGQRQIIVVLEDRFMKESKGKSVLYICSKILRLSTQGYKQELENFLILNPKLHEMAAQTNATDKSVVNLPQTIIDLRVPKLAFIKTDT